MSDSGRINKTIYQDRAEYILGRISNSVDNDTAQETLRNALEVAYREGLVHHIKTERPKYASPEDRYQNDMEFHVLVDTIEAKIIEARYTPSELRQAVILACIHFEQLQISRDFKHFDKR